MGVATQDPRRARALVVADETTRVVQYQASTVARAQQIASLRLSGPRELDPATLMRRITRAHGKLPRVRRLARARELFDGPPGEWAEVWAAASPDSSTRQTKGRTE